MSRKTFQVRLSEKELEKLRELTIDLLGEKGSRGEYLRLTIEKNYLEYLKKGKGKKID